MTTLVEVDKVTKRFGAITAVDSVSLTVSSGEVVGLLGANGAGKTTLIRMILGLVRFTSGSIALFDRPPSRASRSRLGYVPQSTGLYGDLTVAENLAFVAAAFQVTPSQLDPDLAAVASRPLGQISLGLRRRAAFAAALSHRPELLILDEPTSGVGPLGRAELWGTITAAAAAGTGVLVTTHHMEEAEQCDRILMLSMGRVVAAGTTTSIVGSVEAVEVRAEDWHAGFAALDRAGLQPTLVGKRVRVTGVAAETVEGILKASAVEATVKPVRAGFEEAFVALAAG